MNNDNAEQLEQKIESSKIDKKFSVAIEKLTAILQGSDKLKPVNRLPNDQISGLVDELFKEEKEALYEETKQKLKELLKGYHELQKQIKQKEQELAKAVSAKKEEFVKAAQGLFDKIQNTDEIKTSYYEGLKTATAPDEKVD